MKKEGLAARVNAFLEEFPFLLWYVKPDLITEKPKVERIDLDLLDRRAYSWGWSYRYRHPGPWDDVRYLLLNRDGKLIYELGRCRIEEQKFRFWRVSTWRSRPVTAETIHEAFQRLNTDDRERIAYILEIRDVFPRVFDDDPTPGIRVIIHKAPSGYVLTGWLSSIKEIARRELTLEIKSVDTV